MDDAYKNLTLEGRRRSYVAHYLNQTAISLRQASEHLIFAAKMLELDASSQAIPLIGTNPDLPSSGSESQLHTDASAPFSVPFDSPLSGEPESSNREGISPVATTPTVVG